jgi:putative ABC transport system permease protein
MAFINYLEQIAAVSWMSLKTLRERASSAAVAVVGIAGVVAVLVAVLSISEGFRAALELSGADDVAIVLRDGSSDEMGSGFDPDQVTVVGDADGVAYDASGPLISAELYVIVDVPMKSTGTPANVPFRGVGPKAASFRDHFRIVEGQMFAPGVYELVVGRGAAAQFAGLDVGKSIRLGSTTWQITGMFEDDGSVSESEIWTDATVLQGVYNRGNSFQSVRAKLTDAASLGTFKDALTADPRVRVSVRSERQYYADQSRILRGLVTTLGTLIAALMGAGAVFAALNTMYSAVAARTREIATLRAVGFGGTPVVLSVLVESLLLGAVGGVLGGLIAYFGFNGYQANTMNWASFSQLTFAFTITPRLLSTGIIYALILAFIGGLLPGIRAARLPITTGLREL